MGYKKYNPSVYKESEEVIKAREKAGDFQFSKQGEFDKIISQINNREPFSYDLNGDALYHQYKDQYTRLGEKAAEDAVGQAAAMTGGYGNSFAQSVGQLTQQGYMQQLNDKIPELYQLALSKYNSEGDNLYAKYGMLSDLYGTEYGQHRDAVGDYQSLRDYDYNRFIGNEQLRQLAIESANDKTARDEASNQWALDFEAKTGYTPDGKVSDRFAQQSNQDVVDPKQYNKAKKSIVSQSAFLDKAKSGTVASHEDDGWFTGWGVSTRYTYDGQDYSGYTDYVKKSIAYMYEIGEINEATANKLLDEYGIDG